MRISPLVGAFLLLFSVAGTAQESVAAAGRPVSWNVALGRFGGDYGLSQDTTFDILNLSSRWYLARGEIEVSMPYLRLKGPADIQFINGQPVVVPGTEGEERKESGIGDASIQGEYYLRTGTDSSPWVIGLVRLKLPTGDEDAGLGTGASDVEVGVGLIQPWRGVNWLADVGYTYVGSSSTYQLKNVFRLGVGAAKSFADDDSISGYVYLENRSSAAEGADDRRSIAIGIEKALNEAQNLRLSASIFFGLTDASEDVGVYFTLGRRY